MFPSPLLTPQGSLALSPAEDAPVLAGELAARLEKAFARGSGHGLLQLGAGEVETILPPAFAYWREFGARYVTALCAIPEAGEGGAPIRVSELPQAELEQMALAAPLMTGAEYLSADSLAALWRAMNAALGAELQEVGVGVQDFLKRRHPAWNLVGRVHFNLAENRNDAQAPFAFLATYTIRLAANARAQHVPLGQALRDYAGAANRDRLLSLLVPVQRAAERCPWLKAMVDGGDIYHPLRWSPQDAFQFLRDVPLLEGAGVVVRMPASWRMNRPARPQVKATVGGRPPSQLGLEALLDFRMEVTLEGETLSPAEIRQLLAQSDGLALIRGRWIEVDHARLQRTLEQFQAIEGAAKTGGLPFGEAMRLLAGAGVSSDARTEAAAADWSEVVAGPWLAETLKGLRRPEEAARVDPGKGLRGILRPYQRAGVQWLHLLVNLRLGACLADDMGLGKTIQILSLLLMVKNGTRQRKPSLLVAPASLLANWTSEIDRFAPDLAVLVAHPSALSVEELKALAPERRAGVDLVITSYGSLERVAWLMDTSWRLVILDEAQAIKNPNTKQTRAVKRLEAEARVALTGTPIENRLVDLWSIFDFINAGLLGTAKQFSGFVKRLADHHPHNPYGPLRELVRPYILRRLKTDKRIIADLPDKTEIKAFCPLSRKQVALYQQAVDDLSRQMREAEGIQRKGLVLALLMRLKQICNHPSQWLGDGVWGEEDSGKLARLRDLAEVIDAKQEKALVFTQFKEITAPLAAFLSGVFGRPGLVLHGETAVTKRMDLVRRFQEDERVPFFILSLKAGGAGLNLTAAAHVIHFDRWWNPAVENQATDRAFRIGQTKNVLVHKFVCRGTVEDKIDQMIESKQQLAGDFLEGGVDMLLTEMNDDELLKLVSLDLGAAMKEV